MRIRHEQARPAGNWESLAFPGARAFREILLLKPPATNGGAVFESEVFEDILDVLLHGARAALENGGNLVITFRLGDPAGYFKFARSERNKRDGGNGVRARFWCAVLAAVIPGRHGECTFLTGMGEAVNTHKGVGGFGRSEAAATEVIEKRSRILLL